VPGTVMWKEWGASGVTLRYHGTIMDVSLSLALARIPPTVRAKLDAMRRRARRLQAGSELGPPDSWGRRSSLASLPYSLTSEASCAFGCDQPWARGGSSGRTASSSQCSRVLGVIWGDDVESSPRGGSGGAMAAAA